MRGFVIWVSLSAVLACQESGPVTPLTAGDLFDVYADGAVIHVAVLVDDHIAYLRSSDSGRTWTVPLRIAQGTAPPRPGSEVRLAAHDARVIVTWGIRGTGFMGSGPLATVVSTDGGDTWQAGPNPADDGSTEGHGFVDIAANDEGFHLVWLDDRDGAQGLRYAFSPDGQSWGPNGDIDVETCECCWNTLVGDEKGAYVLYRDKTPRDMAFAALEPEGWQRRSVVGAFDWDIEACPHVGGGLARDEGALHAVVWTGREDSVGAYYLRSEDDGRSWSAPERMGAETARHADLVSAGAGRLVVVWDELSDVRMSASRDGGLSWSEPETLSRAESMSHHPRVVATRGGILAMWVAGKGIVTLRLP